MLEKIKSFFGALFGNRERGGFKSVFIGGQGYIVTVPSYCAHEVDKESGTVAIFPRDCQRIVLRFNVLFFEAKGGTESDGGGGYKFVRDKSDSQRVELFEDRAISHEDSVSEEDGVKLQVKTNIVGFRHDSLIIVTTSVEWAAREHRVVQDLLGYLPELLTGIRPAVENGAIETRKGQVEYEKTRLEGGSQTVTPLTQEETLWLQEQRDAGIRALNAYTGTFQNSPITTHLLDAGFAKWMDDPTSAKPGSESIGNGFGVVFGDILAEALNMEWVKVESEIGTELGVKLQGRELFTYPLSAVKKRIESGTRDFFDDLFAVIQEMAKNGGVDLFDKSEGNGR